VTRDPRWRSGAVMAAVVAAAGLAAHVTLRPASEGAAPPAEVLALALVAVAAVLWPLATRTTGTAALTAVFALAQLAPRAVGVVLGGGGDLRSVVCCPPADQVRPGPLGELTAQAGWALAAVQLLACLLLAVAVRGGRSTTDAVAMAGAALRGARVRAWTALVRARLLELTALPASSGPRRAALPTPPPVPLRGRIAAAHIGRRGPPRLLRTFRPGAARARRSALPAAR
jgi:hypothetical protein